MKRILVISLFLLLIVVLAITTAVLVSRTAAGEKLLEKGDAEFQISKPDINGEMTVTVKVTKKNTGFSRYEMISRNGVIAVKVYGALGKPEYGQFVLRNIKDNTIIIVGRESGTILYESSKENSN